MARILSCSGLTVGPLSQSWRMAVTAPGAWADPASAEGPWHPASVPGTTAGSLEKVGLWDREAPTPLHDRDVWYIATFVTDSSARLQFDGLATITEIWLDGRLVLQSTSMFAAQTIAVEDEGEHHIALVFRSLTTALSALKGPRARWRTRMVEDAKLRFVRSTILGNAPGWCPPSHIVGPWRPVSLVAQEGTSLAIRQADVRSTLDGRDGLLRAALAIDGLSADDRLELRCGDHTTPLTRDADGFWRASLRVPEVRRWWPHTHGQPHLYPVSIDTPRGSIDLGRTGFRSVTVDRGADGGGFTLMINGVRVFCRGACWTPVDPVSFDETELPGALDQVRASHANMLRLSGTTVYETPAFFDLCDERGILVWQDCMFANFDYPADEAFLDTVRREVGDLLDRTQLSPSLVVLCGGSEVQQQAAMMGLPERMRGHALFDTVLPAVVEAHRPDLIYVPGSPSGGSMPFVADFGPSHYYGVGAYCLPLEDARRAGVRFASECLTFANVPDDATLRQSGLDPADTERWAARVPRDNGASWDFEDTRHHYMNRLYGVDCAALRAADPQRYRDLSRAVVAEVTERTFDEWRRPGSVTAGGLVWFWRDFWAGAGWGVVDSTGRPKSNFHAMRRAFAPLRMFITDEGVNGLMVHCVNDGAAPVAGEVMLTCLRNGAMRVMEGRAPVEIPARGGITLAAFTLFGAFFDAGHVYKFGPAPHDTVHAALTGANGLMAEATWLLDAARHTTHDAKPTVSLDRIDGLWVLTLAATRMLHAVVIDDAGFVPDDNVFVLVPGVPKRVRLTPLKATDHGQQPAGEIRALNLASAVPYDYRA